MDHKLDIHHFLHHKILNLNQLKGWIFEIFHIHTQIHIHYLQKENLYFESYDNFERVLKIQAGSPRVSPKRLTAFYVREEFRKHAEDLYTKYPEFYYVWQDILSKQIEEDLIKLIEEGANL